MNTSNDVGLELTGDEYRSPLTVDATFADLLLLEQSGKREGLSSLYDAVRHLSDAEKARAIIADPVLAAATKITDFYHGYDTRTLGIFLSIKFLLEESEDATDVVQSGVHQAVEVVTNLTPDQIKLRAMRDSGELSLHDLDLNFVYQLQQQDLPLTRRELGNQALVLSKEDALQLGAFDVVYSNGEQMTIDADSIRDSVFILFPSDLGD